MTQEHADNYLNLVSDVLGKIDRKDMVQFVDLIIETYEKDGTIFTFGNGGSGATASHLCEDIVKGVSEGLDKGFKIICLNDHVLTLMAIANDDSYENIFVDQLKNFVKEGDLVVGISGSGNSPNIVKTIEYANKIGAKTVALCGFNGGKIKNISTLALHIPINNMEVSEDAHLVIAHCVKYMLENRLKKKNNLSC